MPDDLSAFDGMTGDVRYCHNCRRPRIHGAAPNGLPVCFFCGAANVTAEEIAQLEQHPPTTESSND